MAEPVMQSCSRCGKPFDALAPRGVCVHCVLEGALLPSANDLEPDSGYPLTVLDIDDTLPGTVLTWLTGLAWIP